MAKSDTSDVPEDIPEDATDDVREVEDADTAAYPRRWALYRHEDESGVSGEGVVAYGVQFPDGFVAYRWTTSPRTTQLAESIHDVQFIHGHEGKTEVVWIDG